MRAVLLYIFAAALAAAQTISVSPTTIAAGGTVTVTIAGAPSFVDNWVTPYVSPPGQQPGGWLPCCWSWLDGTQTSTPPAAPITSATLTLAAPMTPGTYVYVLHSGNGTTGPYNPAASSVLITVTPASTPQITRQQCIGTGGTWGCKDVELWTVTINGVTSMYTVTPAMAPIPPSCPAGTTTSATACLVTVPLGAPMQ